MTPHQFTLGAYDDSTFQNLKIHPNKAMLLNLSMFRRKSAHALNLKRVTELVNDSVSRRIRKSSYLSILEFGQYLSFELR